MSDGRENPENGGDERITDVGNRCLSPVFPQFSNGVEPRVVRKEYMTSMDGCNTQSKELNGAGGWCYDPNTGVLRVTVVRPLKEYIRFYYGPERDERPSDW